MNRLRRSLLRLERRPWTLAIIAALGVTLLIPSVLALYGPADLLDQAILLGDLRLLAGLATIFVLAACFFRVALRRRRLPEEAVDEEPAPAPPASEPGTMPGTARAHLR
jgi:uncharacterized BrkB/YihY/UPF0761 family membrane protein